VFTTVEYVTIQAPDVVVYADEFGNPTSTSVAAQQAVVETAVVTVVPEPIPAPVAAAAPPPPAITSNNFNLAVPAAAPAPSPAAAPAFVAPAPVAAPEEYVAPPPPAPVAENLQASSRYSVAKSSGYGISWTPFNGDESNTSCKSQEQSDEEFRKIREENLSKVRIYGVGCNQVSLAMRAAAKNGMTVMLGIYDINNAIGEAENLIGQVQSTGLGWDMVESISVGNEDLERGRSVDDVQEALARGRGVLRAGGFNGPVVHVDTAGAYLRHPSMCGTDGGDFIAANIHPFFNPAIMPHTAGFFVSAQVGLLRACSAFVSGRKRSTHRVVVTETGWPNAGGSNGLAVPGREQQAAAIESIRHHLPNDVYLYSAFDNHWLRDNAGTYGVEKHWGLFW
jgi:exo-beta-1,3-glucanase (GH17 family)